MFLKCGNEKMAANIWENDKILAINSNFLYFDSKLRLFDLSEYIVSIIFCLRTIFDCKNLASDEETE